MADTVDKVVLEDGQRNHVIRITNKSDGTGESAVVKADLSAVSDMGVGPADSFAVEYIEYDVQGFTRVDLEFDATANDEIASISGQGYLPFDPPLSDPKSTGYTGDVVLTTQGAVSGASYTIVLGLKKKQA